GEEAGALVAARGGERLVASDCGLHAGDSEPVAPGEVEIGHVLSPLRWDQWPAVTATAVSAVWVAGSSSLSMVGWAGRSASAISAPTAVTPAATRFATRKPSKKAALAASWIDRASSGWPARARVSALVRAAPSDPPLVPATAAGTWAARRSV